MYKEQIVEMIEIYTSEMTRLECRYLEEKAQGRLENESYFYGKWIQLGNVICDLKGFILRQPQKNSLK